MKVLLKVRGDGYFLFTPEENQRQAEKRLRDAPVPPWYKDPSYFWSKK